MRVTHLRKVELGSPDPERLARFYERDWGLRRVAAEDGAVYLRGAGSEHHILVVRPAPSPAVIGYGLGVADAETVDRVAREVARHRGVVVLSPPSPLGGPGGGYGFVIADVDGRRIELSSDVASAPPLRPERGVEPVKISHVVLNSPNAGQFTEMFVDLLGFRLADEMPHMQ
ncbi:MAG TPA: VOC family protein, partial [Acidimicrobiales bacterium]|nr:VOC family protein [Acidimicrobiales bacterium]